MKKLMIAILAVLTAVQAVAQWQPAGDKIKTRWAEDVDPQNPLPEYPRPLLVRDNWINLNGLWNYAIRSAGQAQPIDFDGEILVPFAIESSLSGVQKEVGKANELWYSRTFDVPKAWRAGRVVLNFGAVDWRAEVFLNGISIGSHQGGYTPFSFDITPYLNQSSEQKLSVCVWDPSDEGYQPRGKQVGNPSGIWYTPVTGIWQTVWIESVPDNYITNIVSVPDIDNRAMNVTVSTSKAAADDVVEVILSADGETVAVGKGVQGTKIRLSVPSPRLWSPQSPYLYDMEVRLLSSNKNSDKVKSYAAMRKISTVKDSKGIVRLALNNEILFQYGPLDQGWWPDGLYTAPTDEALLYDIKKTKQWGFNMIRKHVKVEPARWYYHCDREGILVWQDMPSGDNGNSWESNIYNGGTDRKRSSESIENYYAEWKAIMDLCYSNPCVVAWVPFNEAWGQFDTEKVVGWTERYDPSRLVNPASGGNHRACGDMLDLHNYPGPSMYLFDGTRATVLGEYGGIGMATEGHLWWNKRNWGYVQFKNSEEVTSEYVKYADELRELAVRGFAAAVYTQTTDVEGEVNGLMTYDREVIKIDEKQIENANRSVIEAVK